ncbi:hypothetical protein ABT373_31290 [Streptomyces sp. NPDC000070]|uniref:hypothetical protein n=1 Tax=Streptomyces sp. NPDC000070 TaxID=3154240 RepID=UPI00332A279F
MTPDPVTVAAATTVGAVLAEGRRVGIVTGSDISRVTTWLASASRAGPGRGQDAR